MVRPPEGSAIDSFLPYLLGNRGRSNGGRLLDMLWILRETVSSRADVWNIF